MSDKHLIDSSVPSPGDSEFARACIDHLYSIDAAAQELGIRICEIRPGFARLKFTVSREMLNGHDVCHGGLIFSLADTALAYAGASRNRPSLTSTCSIEFLHPARLDDVLTAEAEEQAATRASVVTDVHVRNQDGTTIALLRGRSIPSKKTLLPE